MNISDIKNDKNKRLMYLDGWYDGRARSQKNIPPYDEDIYNFGYSHGIADVFKFYFEIMEEHTK